MSSLVTTEVTFNGTTLVAVLVDGIPHVAIKPICESIGLDWNGQYQRIQRDEVLNSTMCMAHIVAADGKEREMLTLPLKFLNGWMFGVDESKVNPSIKSVLLEYKRECYDVLHNHFTARNTLSISNQLVKAGDPQCGLSFPDLQASFEQLLQDALRLGFTRTDALSRANLAYQQLTGIDMAMLIGFPNFALHSDDMFYTLRELSVELGLDYAKSKPWMVMSLQYLGLLDDAKELTVRGEWHTSNHSAKLDEIKWDKFVETDLRNSNDIRSLPVKLAIAK